MKETLTVWLTNPTEYVKTGHPYFIYSDSPTSQYFIDQGYVPLHDIEVDVRVDQKKVVLNALESLDAKETALRAELTRKLAQIDSARNDLKALTYDKTA